MKKRCIFWNMMLVLVFWGTVLCPPDVCARAKSSAGPSSGLEEVYSEGTDAPVPSPQSDGIVNESVEARNENGYVDMDSDGDGDRFVDEDGDGIDDRHMRRHQKRNRRRWDDDEQRGNGSEYGERGAGGQQGHGSGPGRGGR